MITTLSEYAFSMSLVKRWDKAEWLLDKAIQNLPSLKEIDPESYVLQSASVFEIATNIYWDECEWLEENKPDQRHLAFAKIYRAYQMTQEAVQCLAGKFSNTETMCMAQFNAGECLEKIAEYIQSDVSDPLEKACRHWKTARRIAQDLGDWKIAEECQGQITHHCHPQG